MKYRTFTPPQPIKVAPENQPQNSIRPQRDRPLVSATAMEALWVAVAAIAATWGMVFLVHALAYMIAWGVLSLWLGPVEIDIAIVGSLVAALLSFAWKIWITMALTDWQDFREYNEILAYIDRLEKAVKRLQSDVKHWKREATVKAVQANLQASKPKDEAKLKPPSSELLRYDRNAKAIISAWQQGLKYSRGNVSDGRGGKMTDTDWYGATDLLMRAGVMEDKKGNVGRTIIAESESEALQWLEDQVRVEQIAQNENRVVA